MPTRTTDGSSAGSLAAGRALSPTTSVWGRVALGALVLVGAGSVVAAGGGSPARTPQPGLQRPIDLSLTPDVPEGYRDRVGRYRKPLRQDITALRLTPLGDGRYDVQLMTPARDIPSLANVDFRPFIPRIPLLAGNDPTLVRLALIQRELNRNQTRYELPDKYGVLWIANNCLKCCLWEVGLDREDDKGPLTVFHAWFSFPLAEYSSLFASINGRPYDDAGLTGYPTLGGVAFPLGSLRTVAGETAVPLDVHPDEPVSQLGEQARKAKLVLTHGVRTYGDWATRSQQPIALAKFSEPGLYDSAQPVRFDLSWLRQAKGAIWRTVTSPRIPEPLLEIEVDFANGYRLIMADEAIGRLPARAEPPKSESDVSRLTFGINTPEIYASQVDRAEEFEHPRPGYLVLLDGGARHLDNHRIGIDRVYLWRSGGEASALHLYLVAYERIALVGHMSVPWQAP